MKLSLNRSQWAWALADWANSAYTTTVIAVFFPIFFKQYWASDLAATESTFFLGLSSSINSLVLFVIAPFLGALADISGRKKIYLLATTLLGGVTLIPFFFLQKGDWQWALAFYTLSNIGYWASNIFYDALILNVAQESELSKVSSAGYSLGYLGGGLLIVLNAWAVQSPSTFGLASAVEAVQWSFLSVTVWWLIFSIPLYYFVPETSLTETQKISFKTVIRDIKKTLKKIYHHKPILFFLLAYIFYIDGVNTVIKMAVDFALSIGLESSDLIKAIILVQFIGFPATLVYAKLADIWSDKTAIYIGLVIYASVTVSCYFIGSAKEFYILAGLIGLAQGGLQAISRSYFAKMVPADQSGEFFGVYNMLGKFSAILGPIFVGLMNIFTNNPRISLSVILIFFIIGAALLSQSRPHTPR